MNGHGQSDRSVVPANPPNKAAAEATAEAGRKGSEPCGARLVKHAPGPARAGAVGALPGEPVAARLHPEGGRAAAAARRCLAGGQDRPAGRDGGTERGVR